MTKVRLLAALCLFGGVVSVTGGVASAATSPITVTINVPANSAYGNINMLCGGVRVFTNSNGGGPYTATAQAPVGTDTCQVKFAVYDVTTSTNFTIDRDVAISGGAGSATFDYPNHPLTFSTLLPNASSFDANYEIYSSSTRLMPDGVETPIESESDFGSYPDRQHVLNVAGTTVHYVATQDGSQHRIDGDLDVTGLTDLTWVIDGGIYAGDATSNADGDGVVDAEESGSYFDGDGNNDGTADRAQPNVASVVEPGAYVTFAAGGGITISSVTLLEQWQLAANPPDGWNASYDSFDMSLTGVAVGGSATMRVFNNARDFPQDYANYALYDDGTWSLLPIVVDPSRVFYDVTLVDGGAGDVDHTANGVIETVANYALLPDTTPPVMNCAAPSANWSKTNVSVLCQPADERNGLEDPHDYGFYLTTSVPVGSETADAQTNTNEVCDTLHNCAFAGPLGGNKVDRKAPQIAITSPLGDIPLGAAVTADFTCTDGGSGVASCDGNDAAGNSPYGEAVDTSTAGSGTYSVTAVDNVGNVSSQTVNYTVVAPSGDDDGVSDGVEDGAPNGGDGNNDGTPDSEQDNVTSLPSSGGDYVTFAGPAGTSMVDVSAIDVADTPTPPSGSVLPDGLFSFIIAGVTPGASATVRVFTPSAASATGWAKYHGDEWSTLPAANVSIDPSGQWLDITLVDGGVGDDDSLPNGQIVDPGGVVVVEALDNDAPTVSCAAAPAGWSKVDVSIACTAVDSGSGLADPADASFSLSTSVAAGSSTAGASTGSRLVCDVAGNCVTAGPITGLKVDKLGPTITITSPAGANVTRGSSLTAHFTCADAGSGPSTCVGTVANGASISTSSTGAKSFTVSARDAVGNTSTATVNYQVVAPNVAPVVRADLGVAGLEDVGFQSRSVRLTGSFSDADGAGPYTASVRWQSTGSFVPLTVSGSGFTGTTTYPSSGTRVVSVKVCDAQGACGTDTLTVRAGVTVQVVAVAQCVVDGGSRANPRYTARFGYNNSASYAIVVPTVAGSENTVSPAPALRGQPQVFLSGQRRNVFAVGFNSGSVSWRLNGKTVSISKSTKKC